MLAIDRFGLGLCGAILVLLFARRLSGTPDSLWAILTFTAFCVLQLWWYWKDRRAYRETAEQRRLQQELVTVLRDTIGQAQRTVLLELPESNRRAGVQWIKSQLPSLACYRLFIMSQAELDDVLDSTDREGHVLGTSIIVPMMEEVLAIQTTDPIHVVDTEEGLHFTEVASSIGRTRMRLTDYFLLHQAMTMSEDDYRALIADLQAATEI